jgi:hypothetical protein
METKDGKIHFGGLEGATREIKLLPKKKPRAQL